MVSSHALRRSSALVASLAALAFSQPTTAATIWNEAVNGDLSGNRLAPTALSLSLGTNTILGNVVFGDLDYFTFTVPAGASFAALRLLSYGSGEDVAFLAIQSGSVFTEPSIGANPANLLGYTHLDTTFVGTDILDDLGASNGQVPPAHGFSPPLGPGPYSFWLQQLNTSTSYSYEVVLVPEPASAAFLVLGLASLAVARRR